MGLAELGHDVCMLSMLPASVSSKSRALPPRAYREEWRALLERRENALDRFVPFRKIRSAIFLAREHRLIARHFHQTVKTFRPDWIVFSVLNSVCCQELAHAKKMGIRCAGIAYGSEIHPKRVSNPGWLAKTLRRFDHLIAISDYTRQRLVKWGVSAESVSIVHPALVSTANNSATVHLDCQQETDTTECAPLRLLTICRLVERKGVQTVIEAVAQLRREFRNLRYDIVGDGPYRKTLANLAQRLDVMDCVHFHGLVSDAERDRLLRACDIFVMVPFESADGDVEGFGIVYLEAGLYGKPVIGSRSGGVPDAVRDQCTGVLVWPSDAELMANIIRDLVNQTERRTQLGTIGRDWALEHYPRNCGAWLTTALGSAV